MANSVDPNLFDLAGPESSLEAKIFPTINGPPLHTAFHDHPSIVLI